ncbi:hypothetical protein [Calidithermus chliarophilus]|uniref:hypothetical protein n=1 Tax=Calidithermus chliarophilus TaxID=52023 RepID=UPI00040E3641|nr:hypothetical protein [Calidithermus chliarophilus]
MGKYDARLAELVRDEVIARLEGPGGVIAITRRDLWFLSDEGGSSTPLNSIKRISRGEGNTVAVLGAQGSLMDIPLTAFKVDELKNFLESLKEHVVRARSTQTQSSPPPAAVQAAPPPRAEPEPVPMPEPEPVAAYTPPPPAETVWPESQPQAAPHEPRHPSVIQVPDNEPDFPPAPTQVWEEERTRKTAEEPAAPTPSLEEAPAPVPTPVPTVPERPAVITQARPRSGTGVLMKVLSAVTLAYSLAYVALKASDPAADVWTTLGVVVFGLGLAGIQWRLSETS